MKFISFCSALKVLSKYLIIFGNMTRIHIFIISRIKSDANKHVFLYRFRRIYFDLELGFIICNVELPALCSQKNFKNVSSSTSFSQSSLSAVSIEQSQAMLCQLMQDIITESQCIREEDLCIKEGKLC